MTQKSLDRRRFLSGLGVGGAMALVAPLIAPSVVAAAEPGATYPFTLPPLPYDYSALEPNIDTETMMLHHMRHHNAGITTLNTALKDYPDLHGKLLVELLAFIEDVPSAIRTAVRNGGGTHLNHMIFWATMGPTGKAGGEPNGALAAAIASDLGGFANFKAQLTNAANTRFGSGWGWLVLDKNKKLQVVSYPNQDNPIMDGYAPIVGVDVWEHAYYLKYRNVRGNYVNAWWNVINWESVGKRYDQAKGA